MIMGGKSLKKVKKYGHHTKLNKYKQQGIQMKGGDD